MLSALNWNKIKKYSQKAGKEMVAVAEATFLTMKDPQMSYRQKAVLAGALAYLLSPVDAFPDLLPGGFSDDMSVLLGALLTAGVVGKNHLQQCRQKRGLTSSKEKENENGSTETSSQKSQE